MNTEGKYALMTNCTVYIDEAGDLGINRGTKWFVLTACIVDKNDEPVVRARMQEIKKRLNIREIHTRKVTDFNKRAYIVRELNDIPFTYMNVLVDTTLFDREKIPDSSIAYNYVCKYLLQRVSVYLNDTDRVADVVLSARGTSKDGELITKNPTSACIIPRVIQKEMHPLDAPEQVQLLQSLKGNKNEALIITALFTGMRAGELLGLTWDNVDFDHGVIHIVKQLTQSRGAGHPFAFGTLKNGKTRSINPAPFVLDILKEHKEHQEEQKRIAGVLWNEGKFPNLVFTHEDGSHLSQPTIWKAFQKALEDAGLEHHRLHDCRHTFAVNSIRAGDDIKTIQENMGHYSAAFTLDRYGHVTETMRQESANRMQAFIQGMSGNEGGK